MSCGRCAPTSHPDWQPPKKFSERLDKLQRVCYDRAHDIYRSSTPPRSNHGAGKQKGKDDVPETDVKPGLYIFLGTIGWSLAPLIIEVSDAGLNPFAFYIWYGLGTAIGTTLFLFFYVSYVNIKYEGFFRKEENEIDHRKERSTPILWTRTKVKHNESDEKQNSQNNEADTNDENQTSEKQEMILDDWFDTLADNWAIKDNDDDTSLPSEESGNNKENSKFEIVFSFLLAIIIVAIFLLLIYGKWIADWNWTSMLVPDSAPQNDLCQLDC